MKITTGSCKGRKLFIPKTSLVRPATDKVKQALFNILGDVSGLNILDLFAGCGSLALEALSRGANKAVLVDDLPESLRIIKKNIELCEFEDSAFIIKGRIPQILKRIKVWHPEFFHIVFLDPPYDKNLVNPSIESVIKNNLVDANSLIIIEHSPREEVKAGVCHIVNTKKYGQTHISFVKKI